MQITIITMFVIFGLGCGKFEVITASKNKENAVSLSSLSSPFTCNQSNPSSDLAVRRLSRVEYENMVQRLFNDQTPNEIKELLTQMPGDGVEESPTDFEHYVDESRMVKIEQVASKVMEIVRTDPRYLQDVFEASCLKDSSPSVVCQQSIINRLGLISYRRPLDQSELSKYQSILSIPGSPEDQLANLLYGLMLSPQFNFHTFIGDNNESVEVDRVKLSQYQIASRISFMLLDSPPDNLLFEAAKKGELSSLEGIEKQVERLMEDDRVKVKLHRFFEQWLQYQMYSSDVYSPNFLDEVDVLELTQEAQREINEFIDYIVWTKGGSLTELFTSRASFARKSTLAKFHGHEPVQGTNPGLSLPERYGLLTRLPVIMSEGNESRPILRGVKLRRRLLCDELGPPVGILLSDTEFFTDEARQKWSTRHRTTQLTSNQTCMGCHSKINSLGFPFEIFDSLGRVRNLERSFDFMGNQIATHAIDPQVSDVIVGSKSYEANGPTQLIVKLMSTEEVPTCFIKQLYRFYNTQMETRSDSCVLGAMYNELYSRDKEDKKGFIRNALKRVIANKAFSYRRVE